MKLVKQVLPYFSPLNDCSINGRGLSNEACCELLLKKSEALHSKQEFNQLHITNKTSGALQF